MRALKPRHLANSIYIVPNAFGRYFRFGVVEMMQQRSRWVPQPFGPGWLKEWLKRHQNPISFVLHMIGIPMTIVAIVLLALDVSSMSMWVWATLLFVGGYGLQFVGHAIEGNDAGELILVKKWLGKPYIAVAPQFNEPGVPVASTSQS